MKKIKLSIVSLVVSIAAAAHAQSILPSDITNNFSATYTTPDAKLTLDGFSDSASTVPANLTTGGSPSWFGVEANGTLQNADTFKLQLAPGVGFSGFGDIWTRAVITISGFTSDPGFTPVGSPAGINSANYANGVLTVNLAWNGGTARDYTLANVGASAGQDLTVSLDSSTSPQFAVTHLDYSAVPEPTSAALLVLGGLTAFVFKRRFHS